MNMDNRYYYRLLGLRDDASSQQIKDAYENKIRKLKSDDYADDPEYVARKLSEVRHAYGVLTGSAAPATKAQKKARFEKWKDALDGGEDAVEDMKKIFKKERIASLGRSILGEGDSSDCDELSGSGPLRNGGLSRNSSPSRGSGKNAKRVKPLVIIIAIVLFFNVFLSVIVGGCTAFNGSVIDSFDNDFDLSSTEDQVSDETAQRIKDIYTVAPEFDFEEMIDRSTQEEYEDLIEWEISEETHDQIWGGMTFLASALGLEDNAEAVACITGDDEFYWEEDDLQCAQAIASIMNPPEYEKLAGCTNLYTDTIILNYSDYLWFLESVAEEQTDKLIETLQEE